MLKWIRKKIFRVDGTIPEFAHEILNIFKTIKSAHPELSTDELYFNTVTTYLEKRYVGAVGIEKATEIIMTDSSQIAKRQNRELNLQYVATVAIIAHIEARHNKPISPHVAVGFMVTVSRVIPDHL